MDRQYWRETEIFLLIANLGEPLIDGAKTLIDHPWDGSWVELYIGLHILQEYQKRFLRLSERKGVDGRKIHLWFFFGELVVNWWG